MQTEDAAHGVEHQFFASHCGVAAGGAVGAVGLDGCAECVFCGFHKVASAPAVDVDVDTAGQDISAFGVDYMVGCRKSVAVVKDIKDCGVFNQNRTVFYPSVW